MTADQIIAGPIVRRVSLGRVSVWVALNAPAEVTLIVRRHPQGNSDELGRVTKRTLDVGAKLSFALMTLELPAGQQLEPNTRYAYDMEFDGVGLGALGLLRDGEIAGHRHLALGYVEGLLPTFLTQPASAEQFALAHGSCRRPYAPGSDGLVALDQILQRTQEPSPSARRPHLLFLTGDQIYADDLSPELLEWVSDRATEAVGATADQRPIEGARVDLPGVGTTRFPVDKFHFPIGRRQRLVTRAAGFSSGDSCTHAIGFGDYVMHYVMSWSNVLWPRLTNLDSWRALHATRLVQVRAYLEAWRTRFMAAATNIHNMVPQKAPAEVSERMPYVDAALLVPAAAQALDRHAEPDPTADWGDDPTWTNFWTLVGTPQPLRPTLPNSPALLGADTALRELAKLTTPTWYAGIEHYGITLDYKLDDIFKDPTKLPDVDALMIRRDKVLNRLRQLRHFYEGLPFARRALANISTLMIFDDHEITDDWNVTKEWVNGVRQRALGRDMVSNGMAAYALCQDWGNVPERYEDDSPNHDVLNVISRMFQGSGATAASLPSDADRARLELRFGLDAGLDQRELATWSFRVTNPDVAPYEILIIDSRTQRGFDQLTSAPANLSLEAVAAQIPEQGPADSAFSIVVASMPVLGFPPIEQTVQPLANLFHDYRKNPKRMAQKHLKVFPEVNRDYYMGANEDDPEPWGHHPRALEALFARLSTRRNVVILSGDVHYSLTAKLTYWRATPQGLEPATRIVQCTSSALQNETDADRLELVQMGLAEQLGAVWTGPFDRLAWASGGVDGPEIETGSFQLRLKLDREPVLLPTRMLPADVLTQVRARTFSPAPEWAWRMELVKDLRPDDLRYAPIAERRDEFVLLSEDELLADPGASYRRIANHQNWHASFGSPRRMLMAANLGLIVFDRAVPPPAPPEGPFQPDDHLEITHSLYSWGRLGSGPTGGPSTSGLPWPDAVDPAFPYTEHRVALTLLDEVAPDREPPV